MSSPVKWVANCFLQRDFADGQPTISPMKIQKLVYMMHGWHLAILDEPAIEGTFEAWPYGPVEDELYHVFKQYRSAPINSYANSWVGGEAKSYVVSKSKEQFHDIFNRVFDKYMPLTATQLSSLTHQPGTPWSQIRATQGSIIPDEMIRDHFRTQVVRNG